MDVAVDQAEDGVLWNVLVDGLLAGKAGVDAAQQASGHAMADGDHAALPLRRLVRQPVADPRPNLLVGLAPGRAEEPLAAGELLRMHVGDLRAQPALPLATTDLD